MGNTSILQLDPRVLSNLAQLTALASPPPSPPPPLSSSPHSPFPLLV